MDRPPLHAFVRALAEHERLQALAAALPTRARVSEPVLPLLLATLHEQLGRGLVCLLPEDADARDASEAAGWFIGAEPRRAPPGPGRRLELGARAAAASRRRAGARARRARARRPRLRVGNRRRRGDAARAAPAGADPARGGGGAGRRRALARRSRSPATSASSGPRSAASSPSAGGIVDVFPTTGREPLRVEFFGDEIEQVRVFSPFTQRALHPVTDAVVYPAAERRAELVDPGSSLLLGEERRGAGRRPPISSSRSTACRTSSGSRTRCGASGRRRGSTRSG